jgi:hypothetical protein
VDIHLAAEGFDVKGFPRHVVFIVPFGGSSMLTQVAAEGATASHQADALGRPLASIERTLRLPIVVMWLQ